MIFPLSTNIDIFNITTSITHNVWSTIRHKQNFVSFFANTKGICDDVWTTVSTVRQVWTDKAFDQ